MEILILIVKAIAFIVVEIMFAIAGAFLLIGFFGSILLFAGFVYAMWWYLSMRGHHETRSLPPAG